MKVLILSARAPVALEWARQFQAASWQVFLADHQAGRLSCQSPLPHTFISTPAPITNPHAYIQAIKNVIEIHRIDWLIPTCEEIFYIAKFQDALPDFCRVFCTDFASLKTLHDKHAFNQLAQKLGISAPASQCLLSEQDAQWRLAQHRIIKPLFSRFGHQVQALSPQQNIPKNIPINGSWLLQERLFGTEYCSYSIATSGRLLAHQTYLGAYRYKHGASFYFKPVVHDGITAQVERLVSALNFSGQISFDWMVDTKNHAHVLECNPRATSGLHLLPQDGSLIDAITNETALPVFDAKAKMLLPMMLSHALPQAVLQGKLKQWYVDYQAADDVLKHWRHHVGSLQDAWYFYRESRRLGVPLEAATAADFVWNGEDDF